MLDWAVFALAGAYLGIALLRPDGINAINRRLGARTFDEKHIRVAAVVFVVVVAVLMWATS
jgi:hypothetical protein